MGSEPRLGARCPRGHAWRPRRPAPCSQVRPALHPGFHVGFSPAFAAGFCPGRPGLLLKRVRTHMCECMSMHTCVQVGRVCMHACVCTHTHVHAVCVCTCVFSSLRWWLGQETAESEIRPREVRLVLTSRQTLSTEHSVMASGPGWPPEPQGACRVPAPTCPSPEAGSSAATRRPRAHCPSSPASQDAGIQAP